MVSPPDTHCLCARNRVQFLGMPSVEQATLEADGITIMKCTFPLSICISLHPHRPLQLHTDFHVRRAVLGLRGVEVHSNALVESADCF